MLSSWPAVPFKRTVLTGRGCDSGHMRRAGSVTPCTYLPEVVARRGRTMFVTSSTRLPACGSCIATLFLLACLRAIITHLCVAATDISISAFPQISLEYAAHNEQRREGELQSGNKEIGCVASKELVDFVSGWATCICFGVGVFRFVFGSAVGRATIDSLNSSLH